VNKYTIKSDKDAIEPQPPIDYIIPNLISNSSLNVFYGEGGSKKTYSALSMAVAVANGKDWLNFHTKKCPVLIIDEESGDKRLSRRLNETMKGANCDASGQIFYICLEGIKLDKKDNIESVESAIIDTKAKLVIIDALADVMDGDENSKKDVQPIMNSLRKIADNTDSAILLIHHSNKSGGYRGSTVIKASSDLMIQVSSEPDESIINYKTEKNRDGNHLNWSANATWEDDMFHLESASSSKKNNGREEYVLSYLLEHGESEVNDIIEKPIGCTQQGARKAIYALAKEGKIIRTNPEEGNKNAKYDIV
jgi:predicted ATP-dependent serine protease